MKIVFSSFFIFALVWSSQALAQISKSKSMELSLCGVSFSIRGYKLMQVAGCTATFSEPSGFIYISNTPSEKTFKKLPGKFSIGKDGKVQYNGSKKVSNGNLFYFLQPISKESKTIFDKGRTVHFGTEKINVRQLKKIDQNDPDSGEFEVNETRICLDALLDVENGSILAGFCYPLSLYKKSDEIKFFGLLKNFTNSHDRVGISSSEANSQHTRGLSNKY